MEPHVVRAKVLAGERKESFRVVKPGVFAVSVKEKAERNAANVRVRDLIAAHLHVPPKSVRLVGGHHLASKTFQVVQ